jgi:hypothetical protein
MFGALVRQSGVAQADSAIVGPNGEIRLVATKDLTLDAGSRTTANGASGGNVTLQAQGGTNLVYGTVEAKGSSGQGGTIEALGVRVGVLGNGVIDASGDAGGGTVLVGGDQHGANASVQNAQQTLIGPDGIIRADAATTGDGGRVIVWSDQFTQVYGSVSVRGGAQSGNGGFVETSSAGDINLTGVRIDARAPNGTAGTWLIDPQDVIIEPNSYGTGDPIGSAATFGTNPGTTAHITEQTIENNFYGVGTTHIQANHDVLFKTDLTLAYSTTTPQQTFEVRAINNIDMAYAGTGVHTITTFGQNVVLSANDIGPNSPTVPQLNTAAGTYGSIIGGGNIVTNGGNITLSGYGVSIGTLNTTAANGYAGGPVIVPTGSVSVLSYAGDVVTGSISTNSTPNALVNAPAGSVTLTTFYGNIQVNGTIDARGANGFNARSSAQGSAGGAVVLVRSTQTSAGKITVTGDILTYGGDGLATGATINGQPNGGAGGYISIGANNAGGIPGQTSPLNGNVFIQGNMISRGGNGATSPTGVAGGSGGAGGVILITASNNVTVGGSAQNVADARGGAGATGSAATSTIAGTAGGLGGNGGVISVYGGTVVVKSGLISFGGAGGAGGLGTAVLGYGGGDGAAGGGGGSVTLNATGALVAGPINAAGGYGGTGGTASGAALPGAGGGGGAGGAVSIASTGSYASIGTIVTTSGNGGNAGGTGNGTAFVNQGGDVTISVATTITSGDITTSGGNAGIIGITLPGLMVGGGHGGAVNMNAPGDIKTGSIITTGGAGSTIAGGGAYVGNAGYAGNIVLGSNGSVTTGAIDISGGGDFSNAFHPATLGIGALNAITTGPITARALTPATYGGSVSLAGGSGQVTVNGTIDVRGANGSTTFIDTCGDGCFLPTLLGGTNGGTVTISRALSGTGSIAAGSILASGGAGASAAASAGGNGGNGGTVSVTSVYGNAVAVGNVDTSGGKGADGKPGLIQLAYAGGTGGAGGAITLSGGSVSAAALNASGGAGGIGAADTGTVGASNGGAGGNGGQVRATSTTGNIAVGNINVGGGAGGAGGKGQGVLAGAGGVGGNGGSVTVQTGGYGDIDMTTGGTIISAGGNGGAGGAGDPVVGGNGGNGGIGGNVNVSAAYGSILVLGALNIDGVSFNPGPAPAGSLMVLNGGLGGAGGANFGLGAGTPGAPGVGAGTFTVVGTIVLASVSLGPEGGAVIQGTNQLIQTNNAPSSDDVQKKNDDNKRKNQVAACK